MATRETAFVPVPALRCRALWNQSQEFLCVIANRRHDADFVLQLGIVMAGLREMAVSISIPKRMINSGGIAPFFGINAVRAAPETC